ncbi:MAG: RdgB/HAM1 family non-canonical purine NTP pyrophosphatase [Candidatus Dormibacteria bacterium]
MATGNPGKLVEYRSLLPGAELVSMADLGIPFEVEETGRTFAENALIKARAAHALSGEAVLADDSGLEVEGLDGAPGVMSARYAGPGATQAQLITKLLTVMRDMTGDARRARFRCALVVLVPGVMPALFQGSCQGVISDAPRGDHGFGYDPVFTLSDGRTMAELPEAEKDTLSHRAHAVQALLRSGFLEAHGLTPQRV